jgi:endonuclease/exonuclease/phosphatase family metal-dependent hydrolase
VNRSLAPRDLIAAPGRRRTAAALAALLFITSCGGRPAPGAPAPRPPTADLAVVTWNLHAGAGDLPRFVADLRAGRLTGGTLSRDFVLLLQEAGPAVLALARREGLAAHLSAVHPARGNAIVSSRPIADAHTIELPRERQRRLALAGWIEVADTRVRVATTHFENRVSWWRGGLFSEGARLRQAQALIAALAPGPPTIVGGDFNAWLGRDEPAWLALAERFPDAQPPPSRPTFRERLFLDELFFDVPDGWRVERTIVENRYGSDHHAVVALLVASDGDAGYK